MWQRIQTVFLAVTIISLALALVQPIWLAELATGKVILTPFYFLKVDNGAEGATEVFSYMPYSLTAVLAVAAITLAILEIRRYDNRVTQLKLGAFNTLVLAGVMISAVAFASKLPEQYNTPGQYSFGLYLIFVAVICNWLAVRFIRRDERIVRDADRIR